METTLDRKGAAPRRVYPLWIFWTLFVCAVFAVLYGVFLLQKTGGISKNRTAAAMQTSRTIALAMFQYANDHDGKYPDGNSSTEVFQKLIDGNYVDDPALFYVLFEGVRENVSSRRMFVTT
jgi:hypothetical protein